ncbi:acyl carrier protein [Brevibacillus humidisoli]|uniref:acyl carrier protein n=1 Tax=Brevibacillus humidisoli TaxID=2895522 RepID=UPI001E2A3ED4|nr:acyl carrier protein [Brevibacillus humidisoli]UFJ42444.1 acyl carrier protein [Brevibacillus humidisoli]
MNREQVEQNVRAILAANGVDVSRATTRSVFGSPELQLNSVQFMKVFVDLENTFQLEIDYTSAVSDDKRTLGSLIDYLYEQTKQRG